MKVGRGDLSATNVIKISNGKLTSQTILELTRAQTREMFSFEPLANTVVMMWHLGTFSQINFCHNSD